MDLNGKVYFTRNKDHILWNRIDLMENDHLISFSIKNVSRNDSGYYRLEIRREGYGDLYSRVQIIVEPSCKLLVKLEQPPYRVLPYAATTIVKTTINCSSTYTIRNFHPMTSNSFQLAFWILFNYVYSLNKKIIWRHWVQKLQVYKRQERFKQQVGFHISRVNCAYLIITINLKINLNINILGFFTLQFFLFALYTTFLVQRQVVDRVQPEVIVGHK